MIRRLALYPITLFGVLSSLSMIIAASGAAPWPVVWHTLMLPAYVIHLGIVIVAVQLFGTSGPAPVWFWIITLPFRLAPFVLADVLLWLASRGPEQPHAKGTI